MSTEQFLDLGINSGIAVVAFVGVIVLAFCIAILLYRIIDTLSTLGAEGLVWLYTSAKTGIANAKARRAEGQPATAVDVLPPPNKAKRKSGSKAKRKPKLKLVKSNA